MAKVCRGKKCEAVLPDNDEHKFCEECREKRAEKIAKTKQGIKIAGVVASALAGAAGTAYLAGKLADSNGLRADNGSTGLEQSTVNPMLRNFEVIKTLESQHGINLRSSQQLNKNLESLGIIENIGGDWWQTDFGMQFSPYRSKTKRANEWLSDIVPYIADHL